MQGWGSFSARQWFQHCGDSCHEADLSLQNFHSFLPVNFWKRLMALAAFGPDNIPISFRFFSKAKHKNKQKCFKWRLREISVNWTPPRPREDHMFLHGKLNPIDISQPKVLLNSIDNWNQMGQKVLKSGLDNSGRWEKKKKIFASGILSLHRCQTQLLTFVSFLCKPSRQLFS